MGRREGVNGKVRQNVVDRVKGMPNSTFNSALLINI